MEAVLRFRFVKVLASNSVLREGLADLEIHCAYVIMPVATSIYCVGFTFVLLYTWRGLPYMTRKILLITMVGCYT